MEKDKIIRCITTDGAIMAAAIDSSNIVHTAQCVHKTSPVATAALGRLLTASSIMGAMLKKKDANVSLKINGGGPPGERLRAGGQHRQLPRFRGASGGGSAAKAQR